MPQPSDRTMRVGDRAAREPRTRGAGRRRPARGDRACGGSGRDRRPRGRSRARDTRRCRSSATARSGSTTSRWRARHSRGAARGCGWDDVAGLRAPLVLTAGAIAAAVGRPAAERRRRAGDRRLLDRLAHDAARRPVHRDSRRPVRRRRLCGREPRRRRVRRHARATVAPAPMPRDRRTMRSVIEVDDTTAALQTLGAARAARLRDPRDGDHRQRRQDDDQGNRRPTSSSARYTRLPEPRQPEQPHRAAAVAARPARAPGCGRRGARDEPRRRDQPAGGARRARRPRLDERRRRASRATSSSPEAIADAKAEILEGATPTTVLVANADDPRVMARTPAFAGRVITFGTSSTRRRPRNAHRGTAASRARARTCARPTARPTSTCRCSASATF